MTNFGCDFCSKTFVTGRSKTQHEKAKHPEELSEKHKCTECNVPFDRAEDLDRHDKDKHQAFYSCVVCNSYNMTVAQIQSHNLTHH